MKTKASQKRPLQDGDVFAVPLPPNPHGLRYAAVRVLAANRPMSFGKWPATPMHLIAVTRFVGADVPSASDPSLLQVLQLHHFRLRGEEAISICAGDFGDESRYVCTRPLSPIERAYPFSVGDGRPDEHGRVKGYPLCGNIDAARLGKEAWSEWRWWNEREAFEAEVAACRAEGEKRIAEQVHEPKNPMPDDEFWALIDQLDWSREGDDDAVLEPVVRALAKRTVVDIKAFAETLAHKLFQLDTCAHAKEIGEDAWKDEDAFFSVDTFLYARCAVVANGREVYERALAAPEEMPKDVEFEALLYLAGSAYERRTGKELDYSTGCDFETFSNRKGWA